MAEKAAQSKSNATDNVERSGIKPGKLVGPTEEDLGLDKGFIGPGNPGPADEEFSIQSGPGSPSIAEQAAQVAGANADALAEAAGSSS